MATLISSNVMSTDLARLRSMQDILRDNKAAYAELTVKIASGHKYTSRSENPIETNEAASIGQDLAKTTQWSGNIEYIQGWETATDSYLQNILAVFHGINELTVEADSTINEVNGWDSLASELNTYIESLVANGNAKYLDTSIFAGVKTSEADDPFTTTLDANGYIDSISFLAGFTNQTTSQRSVQISSSTSSAYGILGSGDYDKSIFQTHYTGADGNRADYDVFQTLVDLRKYLSDDVSAINRTPYLEGDPTIDDETLFNRILSRVQRGVDNVVERVVDNASSQAKFENLASYASAGATAATNRYSSVMDLDLTKAATDLANLQTLYQASLQVTAQINRLSITNYI